MNVIIIEGIIRREMSSKGSYLNMKMLKRGEGNFTVIYNVALMH